MERALAAPAARSAWLPAVVQGVGYEKNRFERPSAREPGGVIRPPVPRGPPAVPSLGPAWFSVAGEKGPTILEAANAESPHFILAEFGGQPVGYAFVTSHQGGRLFHLVRIAVAPAYQGRAIGVRLLAEIVDGCANQHADVLTLNTQADNYGAQRLYEWFGFKRTGEQQTVLGADLPGVVDQTARHEQVVR